MRIKLPDTPRRLARLNRPSYVHIRIVSGTVRLSSDQESLLGGDGFRVGTSDGILSLRWEAEQIWAAAESGSNAEMEVLLP